MIQLKSFASTKLINLAQEFRNELLSKTTGSVEAPGASNGMILYEDNISICLADKYTGKVVNSRYNDPKLPEKVESEEIKHLEDLSKDIMPEVPRTCSVYLEDGCLVRCINIKSR